MSGLKRIVAAGAVLTCAWSFAPRAEAQYPRLGPSHYRARGFTGRTTGYPGYGFRRRDYRPFGGGFRTGYHYGHYQNGTSAYHDSHPRVTTGYGFRQRGSSRPTVRTHARPRSFGSRSYRSRSYGSRSYRSRYGR